jgi:hypothetical protein
MEYSHVQKYVRYVMRQYDEGAEKEIKKRDCIT